MTRSRRTQLMASHPRGWVGLAVFAFSAVAVLATACGGGSGGPAARPTQSPTLARRPPPLPITRRRPPRRAPALQRAPAPRQAGPERGTAAADAVKFSSCMRHHGVPNFPNPVITSNGSGTVSIRITPAPGFNKGSPQVQHALQSCQKYLPSGRPSENITTAQQADYVKAAQCMRAHGINGFPDPVFTNGSVRFPLPQNANPNNPQLNPNSPQFEAARHVCQNLIPNGLPYSATDQNP